MYWIMWMDERQVAQIRQMGMRPLLEWAAHWCPNPPRTGPVHLPMKLISYWRYIDIAKYISYDYNSVESAPARFRASRSSPSFLIPFLPSSGGDGCDGKFATEASWAVVTEKCLWWTQLGESGASWQHVADPLHVDGWTRFTPTSGWSFAKNADFRQRFPRSQDRYWLVSRMSSTDAWSVVLCLLRRTWGKMVGNEMKVSLTRPFLFILVNNTVRRTRPHTLTEALPWLLQNCYNFK